MEGLRWLKANATGLTEVPEKIGELQKLASSTKMQKS
jgi:hypothetical protein